MALSNVWGRQMSFLTRRKALPAPGSAAHRSQGLKPTLSWPHLVALGVGAIVGTGIYTLIGVGAERAGPAVMLAFVIAGVVCVCAALAYAELATMIPESGSAYTYSYTTLGEGAAWMVGWSLILEYTVVCSAVAVGWAGYFSGMMEGIGMGLPAVLTSAPSQGGIVNLPAVIIVAAVAGLLVAGTRESASINAVLVVVKIAALIAFVAIALPHFNPDNLKPFMPYGFSHGVGGQMGVMAAAAIIFFAFLRLRRCRRCGGSAPHSRPRPEHRQDRFDGRMRPHLRGGARRRLGRHAPHRVPVAARAPVAHRPHGRIGPVGHPDRRRRG